MPTRPVAATRPGTPSPSQPMSVLAPLVAAVGESNRGAGPLDGRVHSVLGLLLSAR